MDQQFDDESSARLKEVIAIIRPERWSETRSRLENLCLPPFTEHRVLGRGRERGLQYLPCNGASGRAGIRYLPKRMVSWIVEEAQVESLVQVLLDVNRTGRLGDGKVFVLPVEQAIPQHAGEHEWQAQTADSPAEMAWAAQQVSPTATEVQHPSRQ